jgi:hypothetical protein
MLSLELLKVRLAFVRFIAEATIEEDPMYILWLAPSGSLLYELYIGSRGLSISLTKAFSTCRPTIPPLPLFSESTQSTLFARRLLVHAHTASRMPLLALRQQRLVVVRLGTSFLRTASRTEKVLV